MQITVFNELKNYMNTNNIDIIELSKKLEISEKYINQILNGNIDNKLSKLIEIFLKLDKTVTIKFKQI